LNQDRAVGQRDDAVGINLLIPIVGALQRVDLRERQENRRRRNECDKTAVHLLLDSQAVRPPSPLIPRSAMTNFANR
jgi:hypothetical protein